VKTRKNALWRRYAKGEGGGEKRKVGERSVVYAATRQSTENLKKRQKGLKKGT